MAAMDTREPLEDLPPPGGVPTLLFLLFHGVGGSPSDLRPLMQRLRQEYPQAALVSLPAPHPFDGVPGGGAGGQWFSVRGVDDANRPQRVAAALPGFVQAVRAQQARFGVDWQCTALVGFSQGAIMSLEAVQAEPRLAGRVLAFSGRYATQPEHPPVDTTLHLLHGLQDAVVPARPTMESAQRLVEMGADVTGDAMPGIGHELHPKLIEKAVEHLRSFLPQRAWREALAQMPQGLRPSTRPAPAPGDDES